MVLSPLTHWKVTFEAQQLLFVSNSSIATPSRSSANTRHNLFAALPPPSSHLIISGISGLNHQGACGYRGKGSFVQRNDSEGKLPISSSPLCLRSGRGGSTIPYAIIPCPSMHHLLCEPCAFRFRLVPAFVLPIFTLHLHYIMPYSRLAQATSFIISSLRDEPTPPPFECTELDPTVPSSLLTVCSTSYMLIFGR